MMCKAILLAAFLAAPVFLLPLSGQAADPKPILAHYMPWFVAKPYSSTWGWHWTMNHYSPDTINASGERAIASWYYPLIGPYDSADPAVLEYHVLLMKLAGIDGVIVDWYGMDDYLDYGVNNERTLALFDWTRKAGLKFSLCYEDRTIQVEVETGYIAVTNALFHARRTMLYAQTNFFTDPSYVRHGTQPLLLNFGPQYFKYNGQWDLIFAVLEPTNQPAFLPLDNRVVGAVGAFNWPPMWLSQTGVLSTASLQSYLNAFEQKSASWPAHVSSAFPRFHDIYQQAGVSASYGTLPDNDGATFRLTLERALTNSSVAVQIVTWNDFGEGTIVEPTKQYGFRDLGMIQDFRRSFKEPGFRYSTNDLALVFRLYSLRKEHLRNAAISAELDRVFANIVSGQLDSAATQIAAIESHRPAIYDYSAKDGLLQFSVGGYLSVHNTQVQTTSSLGLPDWRAAASYPTTTNLIRFSMPFSAENGPLFFRVQITDP